MSDVAKFYQDRFVTSPQSTEAALSLISAGSKALESLEMTTDQQERFFALITKQSNRWARENEG